MSELVPAWALAGHAELRALLGEENATTQRRLAKVEPVVTFVAGPVYDMRVLGFITPPEDADLTLVDPDDLYGTTEAAFELGTKLTTFANRVRRDSLPTHVCLVKRLACTSLFEIGQRRAGDPA
jgi:hypothetical protein